MPFRNFSVSRSAFEVPPDACLYLHGVSTLGPEEKPAAAPFSMEERGIDGRSLVFAWDSEGLRYYLSQMPQEVVSLGREDNLLLSKQDSIRLRGLHESILNDLRLHGALLPFPVGTVVCGWKGLQRRLQNQREQAVRALQLLGATKWWTVEVSVLDTRFMELQMHDTPEKRREVDRERNSYSTKPVPGRIDVRTLERILIRQHRLAETIHREIEPIADHARVLQIVSLESGSSGEWKPILKASYEIRPSILMRFVRLLTDLQYQYLLQELMISLRGDIEKVTLGDAP